MKGWNKDGIPTLASLYDLDLGYVGEEFLERGILSDGEDAPAEETAAEK
jgi:benzoyl-CoA reductase subunit BamB